MADVHKYMKPLGALGMLLLLLGFSLEALAQCGPGSYPIGGQGAIGCGPLPGPQRRTSAAPAEQWEDRHGSIASDAERGVYESVTDMASMAAAERAAMVNCKAKGGRNCKILLTYINGCAAIAFGDTGFIAETGPTVDAANQKTLQMCSTSTKNCHVEFNTCSLPVRIQ